MRPLPSLQEHLVFLALVSCTETSNSWKYVCICSLTPPLIHVIVSSSNGRENLPSHCINPHFEVH